MLNSICYKYKGHIHMLRRMMLYFMIVVRFRNRQNNPTACIFPLPLNTHVKTRAVLPL